MTRIKPGIVLRSITLTLAMVSLTWFSSTGMASAQQRMFACPHARFVVLTVTGPNTLSADPIDGKPMRMKQDPANPLRFANGEYSVTLSNDQGQVLLEIPDWGSTNCIFGSRNVPPFLPQRGAAAASSCGPGFHPVPETDRCDPDRGTPPIAQPRRTGSAEGNFPMSGKSLGGIMRSAPSMQSARMAGLAEGTPITLLGRAGTMDDYDWFTIQHNGTTGYQWGGIMCSEQAIRGIFQQCEP